MSVCFTNVCDAFESCEDNHPWHIPMMAISKNPEEPSYQEPCWIPHCIKSDAGFSTEAPSSSDNEDWNQNSCSDSESTPWCPEEHTPSVSFNQDEVSEIDEKDFEDQIRRIRLSYQEEDLALDEDSVFYLDDDEGRAYHKLCREPDNF